MTALPLEPHTEAEQRIAYIEAAPHAPESAVGRVALAIFVSDGYRPEVWDSEDLTEHSRNEYRANAAAAIGAMKGPSPEAEALARVEALATDIELNWDAEIPDVDIVAAIRAALVAGQHTTDEERA